MERNRYKAGEIFGWLTFLTSQGQKRMKEGYARLLMFPSEQLSIWRSH
jgi:hypothetical protein